MVQDIKGASVSLKNLVKRYDDFLAVDHVDLDIKPREFITLLGPSGSGKTTTLMMIAGFVIPDSGEIIINNEKIMFRPPYKRDIGMVFQHYSLFPHMTVERNIGFPLRMRKVGKKEQKRRIGEVLELVKLSGYENRFPRQLSGGQQQRIALARAFVFNPKILLMDEPLGALDKKLREHMQLEIIQITRSLNVTVVYVTHDQSEALTMSDRIAVMNRGKIEQIGTPDQIYENPANYFVADFIGESNFIKGQITEITNQTSQFMSERGLLFKSSMIGNKSIGERGYLAIRPEKISFMEQEQSFPNQFLVVIEETVYLGEITMYKVRFLQNGAELFIRQQNKDITKRREKGEKVSIGWKEKDCCILLER